ncbi:MAG: rod shape-determining protein MreD, partial [Sediminibacterium sp.]
MNSLLKNIIRFALFLLLQIVVLNEVPPVHRFIIPYLYFLYILWLPFSMNRFSLLIVAFLFGLSLDYFTGTAGLHAAPCVLIAYIRPYLLNLLLPQETIEQSYAEPGVNSMGWAPYAVYVG